MTAVFDSSLALRAEGLLGDFNRAGILSAADVHVARRLAAIGGEDDEAVLLAVALVVRSTRHGSVVLDLATAESTTSPDVDDDIEAPEAGVPLHWPDDWVTRCAASPLLGGPLRMVGSRLWLGRYWDQEEQVAHELTERCASRPDDLDLAVLKAGLRRLFPKAADGDQRLAAACCALSRVSVLAGGPGHRQDHHGQPGAGAAARAAPRLAHRARRAHRESRRRGWRRLCGRPPPISRRQIASGWATCRRRRCIGCSAGGATHAAGSATTAPTGCRSRSSSSTRARWCR